MNGKDIALGQAVREEKGIALFPASLLNHALGATTQWDAKLNNVLNDSYKFLTYDPYKKYTWSSATWEKIKASKVAVGMNKDQVQLSWGPPHDTSKAVEKNITVEVWRYGYQYIAFTNGTVSGIYSY